MHSITLFQVMSPYQRCLKAKVKNRNESKQVMPKSYYLVRSPEIKLIRTFDTAFPTIFNKSCTYITFKSAVKRRQLSYGYPRGQTYPHSRGNHSGYIFQYIPHVHFYSMIQNTTLMLI